MFRKAPTEVPPQGGVREMIDVLNRNADPKTLIHHVHAAVKRFAGNAPQFDDMTMLCYKHYGIRTDKALRKGNAG